MGQLGQPTTLEQRIQIMEQAKTGQEDLAIARTLGISVFTVRKWRRKAQCEGRSGLATCRGRPRTGALGHTSAELRERIRQMRLTHPGWGPITIRCELNRDRPPEQTVPSRPRIAAFLRQEGLTRTYQRHHALPQPLATIPTQPHEEWQMDAQGAMRLPSLGRVALINIVDRVSRLKPVSWPCVGTGDAATLDYQVALRCAFLQFGLPRRITLDHAPVFYDNTCPSPYPTVLHLWLIALGVEVAFIRVHRPTDQSCIERTHQTVLRQAILGQDLAKEQSLHISLTGRLAFLNSEYPCRSLGGKPPLVAYPSARHSGREYRPEWEESLLDLQRVYTYLACGRWFRRVGAQGQFYLGDLTYGVGKKWANQTSEIKFDPPTQEFICLSADAGRTIRLPAKGLTKAALMGELTPLVMLPSYQPLLPFDPAAWRESVLRQMLTDTN